MTEKYDSAADTAAHVGAVNKYMGRISGMLEISAMNHDKSKLVDPEKSTFDKVTPRLKKLTYGSDEYKASLEEMGPALKHHYENNAHHPEHHKGGIEAMNMLELIEMLCDWKAASERHADGNIKASLEHNRNRFDIPDAIYFVLVKTCEAMGWVDESEAYGLRQRPKKRDEPGLAVEISITGHNLGDVEYAIDEAKSKILDGMTSGWDFNDTGSYSISVCGNEVEEEDEEDDDA